MNVLLISCGDYDYDGRLRELYKIAGSLGTLYAVTGGSAAQDERHLVCNGSYAEFIRQALRYGGRLPRIDLLFLDNRKAVIPGLILRSRLHPRWLVQDCRELYIPSEVTHFAGRIGCYVERMSIRRADVVIAANRERAERMREIYRLAEMPLVFENLRRLTYSGPEGKKKAEERLRPRLRTGCCGILSTAGCDMSRLTGELVCAMKELGDAYCLYLAGESEPEDTAAVQRLIEEQRLDNVVILGRLDQDELKYLINFTQLGIVSYHQHDQNNRYCASGKLFEYIYEGKPVVTTTNPPLARLCEQEGIGVSDDGFADGIRRVMAQYDDFCRRARAFAEKNTVEDNNRTLAEELRIRLALGEAHEAEK